MTILKSVTYTIMPALRYNVVPDQKSSLNSATVYRNVIVNEENIIILKVKAFMQENRCPKFITRNYCSTVILKLGQKVQKTGRNG